MNKLNKKTKIISFLIAVVIIVGVIITLTLGLNFDLKYQATQRVEFNIGKTFEIKDVKAITDEVMPNTMTMIQKVEVYEDGISITAKEITEEQKNELTNKINEKFETELSTDSIEIEKIPHTRGRDILKPYITPFAIATVIILIYMAIRYYKLGILKTILQSALVIIIAQATLLSIMAIFRIPIGRVTIPMVLTTYVLTLIGLTTNFEKKLENKKSNE